MDTVVRQKTLPQEPEQNSGRGETLSIRLARPRPDTVVVTVRGAVDGEAVRALERVLWEDLSPRLIVDLSGVTRLTLAAAGAIIRAHGRAVATHRHVCVVATQRVLGGLLTGPAPGAVPPVFATLSDAIRETPRHF